MSIPPNRSYPATKKQPTKPATKDNDAKAARFEYTGKQDSKSKTTNQGSKKSISSGHKEMTIHEDQTAEELEKLAKDYRSSMKIGQKSQPTVVFGSNIKTSSRETNAAKVSEGPSRGPAGPPITTIKTKATKAKVLPKSTNQKQKQLRTLVDKRIEMKDKMKRALEPSKEDLENLKLIAKQNVKEYEEYRKCKRARLNLVVVGHVDAGKSTLVGHLLHELGHISKKEMHRLEVDSQKSGKGSFKYAWAMDETFEERSRGVTIDIALTQFETSNRQIVMLDAPGHVDFIPAVISGVAQADSAILVIDSTRGEFETGFNYGGQTREHTYLVRSLGVKSLIVAVNKMDNVDWSWNRFNEIVEQMKPFLKQAGFNLRDDVQFVACSGLSGENLIEKRIFVAQKGSSHPQLEGDGGDWASMPSLIEAIDRLKAPERMIEQPVRVCINDIFKGMSSGVFLGAKIISGKIEPKQKLLLLPQNEMCEVKQIDIENIRSNRAFAGDIITIVVIGIEQNKFYRGSILCDPIMSCKVSNRFQARIITFQNIDSILFEGTPIEVHINGTNESGTIRRLMSLLNKSTGELIQKRPRFIVKNSSAVIRIKLERVVCCDLYETNKDLGRFMIRSYGKTIAAGLITKIKPASKIKLNKFKMINKN